MTMKSRARVSVLVPVFQTEKVLGQCLESFLSQEFHDFEIVVCDDASDGCDDEGHNSKKIVKAFEKTCKKVRPDITVRFVYHRQNQGVLQTRRTLVEEAATPLICFTDSDDTVLPNYLETLYNAWQETGAQIVQGKARTVVKGQLVEAEFKGINTFTPGFLEGRDILDGFLFKKQHSSFLISKLITKDLLVQAFAQIPYLQCTMSDDFIIYFYACHYAQKYYGLETEVYNYNVSGGITSHAKIKTIDRWEKVCSAASLYTAFFTRFQENPEEFTPEQQMTVKVMCRRSLRQSIIKMNRDVVPELREEARECLCRWWGEHFVASIEKEENMQ